MKKALTTLFGLFGAPKRFGAGGVVPTLHPRYVPVYVLFREEAQTCTLILTEIDKKLVQQVVTSPLPS